MERAKDECENKVTTEPADDEQYARCLCLRACVWACVGRTSSSELDSMRSSYISVTLRYRKSKRMGANLGSCSGVKTGGTRSLRRSNSATSACARETSPSRLLMAVASDMTARAGAGVRRD